MELVQINDNGPVTNGLGKLNHYIQDEHNKIRSGVMGEGQGLSEEDDSRTNEDVLDVNDGSMEAVQAQACAQAFMQRPREQSQGPLVCWERFLPLRSLKVLLVENDDSTRLVVCALLRNCGYEVVAVENGLQAWKVLENLTNQIDLVLTEVVMPCLSGIGLLRKITNHRTCKTIPVIMMSSNDSMNIVFKCLSKGAVYFLVKPIRKNELQNLWQHVWRKCHSSSGSGSESGIMTQKSTKSKGVEESDNNSGSNDEDIGSTGLNFRDGIDYGSGTQSSWTEKVVEVDSPKPISPWDQLADPPNSTCAQVILSRPEVLGNSCVPTTATRECKRQDDERDNLVMGKDLQIAVPRIPDLQLGDTTEKTLRNTASINKEKLSELNSKKNDEQLEKNQLDLNSMKPDDDLRNQTADLMGVITNSTDYPIESSVFDIPNGLYSGIKEKAIYDKKEIPSLEFSLKRQRDIGDTETGLHEQNVLRHSDKHSAFSRYNSASTANQVPTGNVGSCSPHDISSEAAKTETVQNFQFNPNGTPPSQPSNGSSNNGDMGLTSNSSFTKKMVFNDKPTPNSRVKCLHKSSAFQPVQNSHKSPPGPIIQGKVDDTAANTILAQVRGMKQQVQVQHHHHHYHHHHHHVHSMYQQQLANHDDSLKNRAAAAPHCGLSNVLSAPIEGNSGNQSLNGSTSGIRHGSNGQNGSSSAVNSVGTNIESDNGVAVKSGAVGSIGHGSRSGVERNWFAQREAALNKFRRKRKERCFEKKVRYQDRKKLAEQRPRVRGQFVRRALLQKKDKDPDS